MNQIINKTMDYEDLFKDSIRNTIIELEKLLKSLKKEKLRYSSWFGKFDLCNNRFNEMIRGYNYQSYPGAFDDCNVPWYLYWEISHIATHVKVSEEDVVLDIGGSSSVFSFYLANRGCKVYTIELKKELVKNADLVAKKMGWDMINKVCDARNMNFKENFFDKVFSISVLMYLKPNERRLVVKKAGRILKDNGYLCLTFDYENPARSLRITKSSIYNEFVYPSGLRVYGNKDFYDNGKRYLLYPYFHKDAPFLYKVYQVVKREFPIKTLIRPSTYEGMYTMGALFLEKKQK
jgi:ubiquinone/menaquinone biosynthesis C-methylase UbiE